MSENTALPLPQHLTAKSGSTLRQSTLINSLDAKVAENSSGFKSKKRTITLVDGVKPSAPVKPEIIEAMKRRIIELEDALALSQKDDGPEKPVKRARKSGTSTQIEAGSSTSASASVPSATSSKADEKKHKMHLKKIFDRLKKECKSDSCKFQGSPKTVKFDEILEVAEFEALFGGKGTLIQPTPQNKPKSTVTIIHFANKAQLETLFGDELKPLKGNRWTRGGIPTRTFGGGFWGGGGSTMSRSVKQGQVDVDIAFLEVNYSKNGLKATLKFDVREVGAMGGMDDDDYLW